MGKKNSGNNTKKWIAQRNKFDIYTISNNYLNFLRRIDSRIPQEHSGKNRQKRPFIGIIVSDTGVNYFIPLSSPKPKHKKMKNTVDFSKIGSGGVYGALNFNNMFPVPDNMSVYSKVDITVLPNLTLQEQQYRLLLNSQLSWLNTPSQINDIVDKAKFLHDSYFKGTLKKTVHDRCCDFALLEKEYKKYSPRTIY